MCLYIQNIHPISRDFNILMPTVKRKDLLIPFLHPALCVNILPLNGLQLVRYDPFHGFLTIEFCYTLPMPPPHILWFYFFRWLFIVSKCLRTQKLSILKHIRLFVFHSASIQKYKELRLISIAFGNEIH